MNSTGVPVKRTRTTWVPACDAMLAYIRARSAADSKSAARSPSDSILLLSLA